MSIKKYNDYHYERIDVNKLSPQFNEIISKFESSKSVEEQSDLIREVDKVFSEYSTYQAIAHLNFARDTKSKETKAESEYYDKIDPSMSEFSTSSRAFFNFSGSSSFTIPPSIILKYKLFPNDVK